MEKDINELLKEKDKEIEYYKREIDRLRKLVEYYKRESCTDSLTNLDNRRSIEDKEGFDVVILGDIDYFKRINDTYGHDLGDQVLIEISNILRQNIRNSDLVCRWGGEEFVILLKNCKIEDAYEKAMILKDSVESLKDEFGFKVTMSFGVSDMTNKTMKKAIKEADEAMYNSKENGRNRVTVYELKRE